MNTAAGGRHIITHSRSQCAKTCLRKHELRYVVGLQKEVPAEALRIGSAFHLAKELTRKGIDHIEAIGQALTPYEVIPPWSTEYDWRIERETIYRLLVGYLSYWPANYLEAVETEMPFEIPIIDPVTGIIAQQFVSGGKIDGIVRLPDGRLAIDETKTTSSALDDESDFWARLRIDDQISRYFHAARQLGFDIACVHYDVIRKPTIEPRGVPIIEDGAKVVLDRNGVRQRTKDAKKWRETGDAAQGWTLQTRPETPDEYGDRISDDIAVNPSKYFARREVTRTESDIAEFLVDQWQVKRLISSGMNMRNTGACLLPYRCEYFEACSNGWKAGDVLPNGFKLVDFVHPELQQETVK